MNRKAGYSLLEVLIAFAVMSLVLAALLPGQAKLLSRTTEADRRLLAQDYALSRLDQIGITTPLEIGQMTQNYRNWTVEEVITEHPTRDNAIQLLQVRVIISAQGGNVLATVDSIRPAP
ncbi:type IV pilus modification PilV family protein [Parasulfitobacter algicola]|uniref:Prepilin-type N-terminal cleavage/methylation domain-containing protein n=1 Tax=Parasulfitobacter algicola TaxID=2614809 RepID=A0ABX2J1L8_9RHOB|nr:type II secretion system protein [Sulfitobacter algicola]NSX56918.1 prepilin-type N-terminal cleavage/methylation domain-containing protein [Sulfitobacter algicola]